MILRYIKPFVDYNTGALYKCTVNKTYQCLPTGQGSYFEVLVYNDAKEWQVCVIQAFAPIEPAPLIEWEE